MNVLSGNLTSWMIATYYSGKCEIISSAQAMFVTVQHQQSYDFVEYNLI